MAIASYVGATLDEEVNTFGDWFAQTNLLIGDMGTKVVSAEANTTGASTTGNVAIDGILSANTLVAVDEIRGGTVAEGGLLTLSSNTVFTGNTVLSSAQSFTVSGNTFVVSSNVATYSGNTVTYNSGNTNFNGTNVNFNADDTAFEGTAVLFSSNTVTFSGTNLNITSNTSFSANTITMNNLVINDTFTLGAEAELLFSSLTFSANVTFEDDVTVTGTVTATDFNSTSDITLKENVETLSNSVDILKQIHPVSFNWKSTGYKSYGVIAQELEAVLPDLVNEREDGIKTVAYTQLIGFLIGAIQEQQKEIDHIKSLL
jgi:hypothetical protein